MGHKLENASSRPYTARCERLLDARVALLFLADALQVNRDCEPPDEGLMTEMRFGRNRGPMDEGRHSRARVLEGSLIPKAGARYLPLKRPREAWRPKNVWPLSWAMC